MNDSVYTARNLKSLREANNFTQEGLSRLLGIKRSAYSNYEAGSREIPLEIMERLADLYGCDLLALYKGDDESIKSSIATAFRIDNLSSEDLEQIASFKKIVKNYMKMDLLLRK